MVLRCAPLLWRCSICIVLWMGPKECVCSIKCFAKFEVWLFVLNAPLCSLNRAKITSSLSHICLVAVRAGQFAHSGLCVLVGFVCYLFIVH